MQLRVWVRVTPVLELLPPSPMSANGIITGFVLIDAVTDLPISSVQDGTVTDLGAIGTTLLNM